MLVLLCILFTLGATNTVRGTKECDPGPFCQENEHYVQDSQTCQKTCLNYRLADTAGACQPFTGCDCDEGFVRLNDDATGPCIRTSDCDVLNCNGDLNATYKQCPWACPATCAAPDAISVCKKLCLRAGCECKPGYIRSDSGGSCIRPADCPGGDPCHGNQTFVACKVGCPTNYCPASDSRAIVACSPPYPCPPGCVCKSNHLRLSRNDTRCLLTSDCPKVNCTRQNEEWNACPSNCLAERCSDVGKKESVCDRPYSYCRPQCVCKEGFYRNRSDICVPAGECLCQKNEQYVQNSTIYQKTCGNRLVSRPIETVEPFTGCICAEGFVRPYDNATGSCIPVSECAPIPTDCGYNEEPTSCKVVCPPQSCAIAFTEYSCIERPCEPGCNCIENYLRNSSEICILNDDCPPPQPIEPVCGLNEEPTDCEEFWPYSTCESVYDYDLDPTISMEILCTPGCKCIDNYLRDGLGICIPREECQSFPENEHYVQNSTECQKTCGNRLIRYEEECPAYTGYVCDDGYVRPYDNATGPCIPVTDCAPIPNKCGYNEEPTSCKWICPPQSCASPYTEYLCLERQCEPGCNCIENHLRNSSEICIFSDDCFPPQPLPENEHYVENSTECQKTCGNRLIRYVEECPAFTGYVCDDGYVRPYDNATGPCIPVTDCAPIPKKCGYNEEPTSCKVICPPQSCAIAYTEYSCLTQQCEPGCNCIENHLRNSSQICILNDDCPPPQPIEPECGPNAEPTDCEESWPSGTCDSLYDDDSDTTMYSECLCTPGCKCVDNYLRDSLGNCIPREECPQLLPENEHYVQNSTECQKTCGNRLIRYVEECPAYTGYVCDDGYVRPYDNATGPCIHVPDCAPIPKKCGYNEEPTSCKVICPPQSCEIAYTEYLCLPRECEPGCNCIENYLRNSSQICILNDDCPPPQPIEPECGPNAEPTDCEESWPSGTCDSLYDDDSDTTMYSECLCTPGCKCVDNYLRDSLGNCIPREECPQLLPKNEHYVQNSTECQKTCGNRLIRYVEECPAYTGYVCDDGYVRPYDNATGSCIPVNDCAPIPKKCGYNEEPTSCKVICPPQSCAIAYTEYLCLPRECEPGCNCIENYLRNSSQICILNDDCPPPQPIEPECGPNAEPTDCEESWPSGTCDSLYDDDSDTTMYSECLCTPGCKCVDNYLRDSLGNCIPREECPQSLPENEHYVQNSTECQNTCGNRLIGYVRECPVYSGYVCNDGYVRPYDNATGTCIPVSECAPIPTKCGFNEEPTSCKITCPPESCDISYTTYLCSEPRCSPGCNCIQNHLRNSSDICILNDECPPPPWSIILPECGPNEISIDCAELQPPDTCESPSDLYTTNNKRGKIRNIKDYCTPGCRCNDNYRRNRDGKCIPIEECPRSPPNNEHYVYNSTERQKTCGNRLVSGQPEPSDPYTGYVCDSGYVRLYDNASGACILESDCEPIPTNCSLNEEPTSCAAICPPQSCEISYTTYICEDRQCKPGCNCIENYLRNSSGICIFNNDCPPQQQNISCDGDKNATYKECPLACPPTCDSPNAMSKCTKKCSEFGCECQPGYIRLASDGPCILPEDCPGGNPCGSNKTFVYCKVGCPTDYCPIDDSLAMIACSPPYPCPPGCACIANNLIEKSDVGDYDDQRCILSSDCSPVNCTRQNEEWNPCPGLCLAERCSDIGKNQTECFGSYPYCGPKCVCKEGFYRNESDICVPAAECYNNSTCNGPNKVVSACPWPCPATCQSPRSSSCGKTCTPNGCDCESGYLLSDEGGTCIRPEECKNGDPCGVNGTFSDCSFRCPNQYCPEDDSRLVYACKPGRPCPPGCMCKENYLRISSQNDTCVLARDCPKVDCTRQNEIWDSCSSECLAEKCEDMYAPNPCIPADNPNYIKPTPSPSPVTEPCADSDENDNSSSYSSSSSSSSSSSTEYRKPRQPQCIRTCAEPKPKRCSGAIKNCCKDGYILSEKNGKCIKIEDCPKNIGCNGDKHAVVKACPLPCPATCANPNYNPCKRMCDPVGCECQPGYILSKENGKCILPDNCKGGNPCGPNGVFFPCKSGCPTDYCPVDDRRGILICETYPFSPCYPGCGCKLNHKFKSREDKTCILSYECPKVNCTRPYEEWSSCPSACLAESCRHINNQPSTCNTLVFNCDPKCICKKKHFRNESDICIPAKKCPPVTELSNN